MVWIIFRLYFRHLVSRRIGVEHPQTRLIESIVEEQIGGWNYDHM